MIRKLTTSKNLQVIDHLSPRLPKLGDVVVAEWLGYGCGLSGLCIKTSYRKPYLTKVLTLNRPNLTTYSDNHGQQQTLPLKPTLQKKKKIPLHEKILMLPHNAHISLYQLTYSHTFRQSQKSEIANALKIPTSVTFSLNHIF